MEKKSPPARAPESKTHDGKSEFGLKPELVEAKERDYTAQKSHNGAASEAQEAAQAIEERLSERENVDAEARQHRP